MAVNLAPGPNRGWVTVCMSVSKGEANAAVTGTKSRNHVLQIFDHGEASHPQFICTASCFILYLVVFQDLLGLGLGFGLFHFWS